MDSQDTAALGLQEIVVANGINQATHHSDASNYSGFPGGGVMAGQAPYSKENGHRGRGADIVKSKEPWESSSRRHHGSRRYRNAAVEGTPHEELPSARKPSPKSAPPPSPGRSDEEFKFGEDLDDDEVKAQKPFYLKFRFYRNSFLFLASFALIVAGVLLKVLNKETIPTGKNAPPTNNWQRFKAEINNFELWRWLFFFGGLAPIWWVGDFVVRVLVLIVESAFLNTRNVMYFLVAIRKPFGHLVRAVLLMPLYVPLFSPKASTSDTASTIYTVVLKVIACLILFTFANVLSTLLAKIMASHFHKATHFHKMQEAIRKEYYLGVLSAPRPGRGLHKLYSSDMDLQKMGSSGGSSGDEAKLGATNKERRHSRAFATQGSALSNQLYNTLVAPVAKKVLPGGQGRASSAPLNFDFHSGDSVSKALPVASSGQPLGTDGAAAYPAHKDFTFSNPLALPPISAPPIRVFGDAQQKQSGRVPGFVSPPRPRLTPTIYPPSLQTVPTAAPNLATISLPEHGSENTPLPDSIAPARPFGKDVDPLTDPAPENYSGAGNAEKVAAAREKARRMLAGHSGRGGGSSSSQVVTPAETPTTEPSADAADLRDLSPRLHVSNRASRRWSQSSPFFRRGVERSEGSRQKLLNPLVKEGSGIAKWTSMSTQQKFSPEELIAETIANSEKPPDLREGDEKGEAMAARLHAVEKHLRKNPLQGGTFVDKLHRSTSKKGFQEAAEKQAKRVAFYIYWNLKPPGRSFLTVQDFECVLPLEQSREAFQILDKDGNGQLTPKELCMGVTQIFKERTDLAMQLKDTKSVVGRLKFVISIVLHILFAFFYLTIFNVDIQKVWLLFSSVVLAFAFVFGNSIRQLYEAVIFLFVIHPYDVGDWLLINNNKFQVEEISLAMTTIRGADCVRQYFPNTQMTGATIINLSRSDNKFESIMVPMGVGTPSSVVEEVTRRVDDHLRQNKNEFTGDKTIVLQDITNVVPIRITMLVAVQMTHSGSDVGRTLRARSGVIAVINDTLQELGVFANGKAQNIPDREEPWT